MLAFDTVDCMIILKVLENRLGITNDVLGWLTSYLCPRFQRVCMSSKYATNKTLSFSVSQGSCAGPVLFNIHSSTICDHVPDYNLLNGFADDHTLQINCTPIINEMVAIKNLENSLEGISEWMC